MINSEYLKLSKELQRLVKSIPLKWGRVQNNETDKQISMFNCKTLSSLETEIRSLSNADKTYFRRRWFLWRCAQVDEYLFYKENNISKNPDHKDQSWDIVFNNSSFFDVKGTIVPKSLRENFKINPETEKKLIDFYFNNQSKGVRYNIQNRLFIVHHSYKSNERSMYLRCHWDLKENAYKKFNNLITNSKLNLISYKSVFAKCIFIMESKEANFYYKII